MFTGKGAGLLVWVNIHCVCGCTCLLCGYGWLLCGCMFTWGWVELEGVYLFAVWLEVVAVYVEGRVCWAGVHSVSECQAVISWELGRETGGKGCLARWTWV